MNATIRVIFLICAASAAMAGTTKTPGFARFALCQTPVVDVCEEEQIDELFNWVRGRLSGDEDVVVLPEYAFTSLRKIGEAWRHADVIWGKSAEFALENGIWLFVNHPCREDGEDSPMFNESRIFSPEGEVFATYRKRCLANMDYAAGFSPGKGTVVADLPFGRVGLLICKDAQYPEKQGSGYATSDILLVQYAHPGVDDPDAPEAEFFPSSEDGLQLVRDVRHRWNFLPVPFMSVNKTGPDGNYVLSGGTFAADGDGEIVVFADTEPDVVEVELPLLEDGRVAAGGGNGYAEAVGGITWNYTVSGGKVSVGGGSSSSNAVPKSTSGAIATPSKLGGYPVTGIGDAAFYKCAKLTSITVPDSVTNIGTSAFYGCSGLKKLYLPYRFKGKTSGMSIPKGCTVFFYPVPTYSVKFSANGGKLPKGKKMAAQTMTYGKAAALRKNVFTRSGYVFIGWAKTKTGAVAYKNAQAVKNLLTDGKATTLYAVWAKKTYKVAFYANGGKGKMAVESFTYGKAKKLTANKFKAPKGKKFAGWATSAANAKAGKVKYKNKQEVKNLVTTGKTVKLYAVWKKK